MVVHAEVNAVITAGCDLTGCTLYCSTGMPCPDCMGVIIQAGVSKVVYPPQQGPDQTKGKGKTNWDKMGELSEIMALEAGLSLVELPV